MLIDHLTFIHSLRPTLMFQAISQGLTIIDTCQNQAILTSQDLIFMTTQAFIVLEMISIMDITVVADWLHMIAIIKEQVDTTIKLTIHHHTVDNMTT